MNTEKLKQLLALFRRHLFSVICTVVAAAALVTSGLWWLGIQDLRDEHEFKSKQNAQMTNLLKTGPVLKNELAAVKEFTQRLDANLTVEDELSDNDDYFRKMWTGARVRPTQFEQSNPPPLEEGALYKRVPFTVGVIGTYAQTETFLHAVETGPRLATITGLSMARTPGSTDVALEINLELIGKK